MSEQPMPRGKGKPVFPVLYESILPKLKAREEKGIATYKQSLKTWNGRNVHRDLEDEQMDGLIYATQARMEYEDLLKRLRWWQGVSTTSVIISVIACLICGWQVKEKWHNGL